MKNLPLYIPIVFIATSLLTVGFFYLATKNSKKSLLILFCWMALHTILGLQGFYTVTDEIPPRFALLLAPPLLFIIGLFITAPGRRFIDSLDIKMLTLLHVIRIPIELVLFGLAAKKAIPELMTFEGRNFDILSGITAPLVYYFVFVKKQPNKNLLLFWNFICLGLLVNIVINAVLSAPLPFQQFAFDQPNLALLYFPFIWLPCCVVPLVLLAHLASIRQLLTKKNHLINSKQ